MTITQDIIRYKTKVSHNHMVVIYHQNTTLPKVRKDLDGCTRLRVARADGTQGKLGTFPHEGDNNTTRVMRGCRGLARLGLGTLWSISDSVGAHLASSGPNGVV
jgi:hypothetical protein